ncbi:hypothetical protein AB3M89_13885 [Microbacterium sp. 179-I 3D2 NHS]|uniref:hypothetical protein n=1 Tax=Microbacterium sp. 179-I 3D2 NHS TaxID=3235178 RepID=UPI0039A01B95
MKTSLSRTIAFWLLLVLSLVSVLVGGWMIASQLGTMTTTLLDGTATGVEVYVGQSLVVVGAAVLGAGIIGVLLAVGLAAVTSVVTRPVAAEPVDTAEPVDAPVSADAVEPESEPADQTVEPAVETSAPADRTSEPQSDAAIEQSETDAPHAPAVTR